MLDMERYINRHVTLDVIVSNKTYQISGKIVEVNANITKLAVYKHRRLTNRYIPNEDIVGVEDTTIL